LLERFGDLAVYWWPIGPVALVALGVLWVRSGRASSFSGQSWTFLKLVPWMRSLLADFEAANFAELLALLIEHGVTYPRALLLAAEASGNARLVTASSHLAEAIERGEPAKSALDRVDRAILPMLRWVLAAGERQGSLVTALRNLGVAYRTRASYKAESLRVFLPTLLMIGLGATATLFYGLTLFYPLASLLRQLGSP
jgi:general secretion pathway protein F